MTPINNSMNDVYGVGHALVDLQYSVDVGFLCDHNIAKGVMTLVDTKRQKQLQSALSPGPTKSASGGSAANTMIAVARFGGRAHYAFQVGDDEWGSFYKRDLSEANVKTGTSEPTAGRTGQCMVFVTPDADRTMNTFLGASAVMGPNQIDHKVIAKSQYVYLEGYLLTSYEGMRACELARNWAHDCGVAVALTLSDPAIVQAFHERFDNLVTSGLDLVFCNDDEALAFTQNTSLDEAMVTLGDRVPTAFVTRGADGAQIADQGVITEVDAVPVAAIDTTGAGDSFAGGVLFGITHGYDLVNAAQLGCFAAAEVVAKLGPRLERDLQQEIDAILNGTAAIGA